MHANISPAYFDEFDCENWQKVQLKRRRPPKTR